MKTYDIDEEATKLDKHLAQIAIVEGMIREARDQKRKGLTYWYDTACNAMYIHNHTGIRIGKIAEAMLDAILGIPPVDAGRITRLSADAEYSEGGD